MIMRTAMANNTRTAARVIVISVPRTMVAPTAVAIAALTDHRTGKSSNDNENLRNDKNKTGTNSRPCGNAHTDKRYKQQYQHS